MGSGSLHNSTETYSMTIRGISRARILSECGIPPYIPFGSADDSYSRINLVAQKLVSANASSNPTYIFDDKAPSLLARLFNLGPARFNPTKQIQAHLVRVVQEANEVIANILPSERYIDEDIGIEMSLACPNYNAHYSGYIVYVSVPIELPFEPFEASDALKTAADVDVAPISQDWLEAVGADLCKPVSLLP